MSLTTRFLNGKMLMFRKVSIKNFVYDLIDIFMFPNVAFEKFIKNRCYLDQNLTNTDSISMFFVFICNLNSNTRKNKARNIIFEVMLKRLDI